jgi:hypothetical protein
MKNNSTSMLLILALLVAAVGYWFFFMGEEDTATLSPVYVENQAQTQFQALVGTLPVSFDTSIFSDARFSFLEDLSTPVIPEPVGRADPFAALSGEAR